MEPSDRQRLEDLANELEPHRGADAKIDAAHADVRAALGDEPDEGLLTKLERHEVELESEHPALGALLRQVIDSLSASGL
jgi:hypothetical protein